MSGTMVVSGTTMAAAVSAIRASVWIAIRPRKASDGAGYTIGSVADLIDTVIPAIENVKNQFGNLEEWGTSTLIVDDFFTKPASSGRPYRLESGYRVERAFADLQRRKGRLAWCRDDGTPVRLLPGSNFRNTGRAFEMRCNFDQVGNAGNRTRRFHLPCEGMVRVGLDLTLTHRILIKSYHP